MKSKVDYTLFEGCTEGPWEADYLTNGHGVAECLSIISEDATLIAYLSSPSSGEHDVQIEANARLIASAHLLLTEHKALRERNKRLEEALRRFVGFAEMGWKAQRPDVLQLCAQEARNILKEQHNED